ncbi:hypothetical protein [Raoultella planticola]|nr:hypothetical protein [Raoultella planticola]MDV1567089.1 hypothetical protein [Raoultella planticola]MDV1572936.1 hypothetical protein [Raoultella planticola]MDV1633917.1 hypothetical protein [Raoultella planticola]MDW2731307.1 hypothetical protein [Raoultella planticola]WFO59244.1 hypothetical protein O4J57_28865 [Raoultella planticola]
MNKTKGCLIANFATVPGLLRIACFGLILAGIIGLKILAGHKQL